MADSSLFITIATVIATLSISKERDESGAEITPVYRMSDGTIRFVRMSALYGPTIN